MQPDNIVLNGLVYGLRRSTVELYQSMMRCGFSYDTAMQNLKELYDSNKAYAHLSIEARVRSQNEEA